VQFICIIYTILDILPSMGSNCRVSHCLARHTAIGLGTKADAAGIGILTSQSGTGLGPLFRYKTDPSSALFFNSLPD
jgi:hypothetical protein